MTLNIQHNRQRRKNFNSVEKKIQLTRWILFSLIGRASTTPDIRSRQVYFPVITRAQIFLMLRKADFSISKIKSTCYVSRRNRGVSRAFRLSRMSFKEQVQQEYFVGVTRFPAK